MNLIRIPAGGTGRLPASFCRAAAWAVVFGSSMVLPQSVGAQQSEPPEVRDLLARAEQVYDGLSSMQAEFDQTIEIALLGRKRSPVEDHVPTEDLVPEGKRSVQDGFCRPCR